MMITTAHRTTRSNTNTSTSPLHCVRPCRTTKTNTITNINTNTSPDPLHCVRPCHTTKTNTNTNTNTNTVSDRLKTAGALAMSSSSKLFLTYLMAVPVVGLGADLYLPLLPRITYRVAAAVAAAVAAVAKEGGESVRQLISSDKTTRMSTVTPLAAPLHSNETRAAGMGVDIDKNPFAIQVY